MAEDDDRPPVRKDATHAPGPGKDSSLIMLKDRTKLKDPQRRMVYIIERYVKGNSEKDAVRTAMGVDPNQYRA